MLQTVRELTLLEIDKMKSTYSALKEEVRSMNKQRGLSSSEYTHLRKLKQLKLWYKDKIASLDAES